MTEAERRQILVAAVTAGATALVTGLVNWAIETLKARTTKPATPPERPSP